MTLNIGGTFSLNKNKIKDQAEEPRAYDNLVTTGYPLNSIWGLKAVGLFKDTRPTSRPAHHRLSLR